MEQEVSEWRGRELKGTHFQRLEMMLWDGCMQTGKAQSNNRCDKRTASWDGDDRHVSASTHAHTHFASVRVTYEIPTVAQRRNIVGKCQGFDASPVGIKRTVNTHEAQSAPAETYGSHLSRSTARQIVFSPLLNPTRHNRNRRNGVKKKCHIHRWGGGGCGAGWDYVETNELYFGARCRCTKGSKTIIKENQPLNLISKQISGVWALRNKTNLILISKTSTVHDGFVVI